jgi:hypothetical protein
MLIPDPPRRSRLGCMAYGAAALRRAVPGIALAIMGAGVLLLAGAQPAWRGNEVGPGLMAQFLGKGILALGVLWAVLCAARGQEPRAASCEAASHSDVIGMSGPLLLGGVLVFALTLPLFGLVIAAGLAAICSAIGAGERAPRALALTVIGLACLTALIGVILLPPTAPLWPRF